MSNELKVSNDTNSPAYSSEGTRGGRFYRPNVDILENEEELLLKADMPGASVQDISVDYENGQLILHGSVKDRGKASARHLLREYGIGDFHREFDVRENIDSEAIAADYKDGVLTIRLPKSAAVKPRRVEVKTT